MAAPISEKPVALRILFDEEKKQVVYAQAGKDFVDILLSFLTIPLGTIVRLVGKESEMKKVNVGSLNKLYESVANLDVNHFWTETCKEMLLQPRSFMEEYCQNLKINIDDTEKMKFFICQDWECSRKKSDCCYLSIFKNKICKCGKPMNREILDKESCVNPEGFVQDIDNFIILDNMMVMPDNVQNCVFLPMSSGFEHFNAIKVYTVVNITRKEIVDLLKCTLVSDTPLTDYFFRKKNVYENAIPRSSLLFNIGQREHNVLELKVVIMKSKMKVLFAVAEADFVDILFSFLTIPFGSIENMLKGNSGLGSIDNLYKGVVDLDRHKYFKSPSVKAKLVNTPLAQQFKHRKQILPINDVPTSFYACCTYSSLPSNSNGNLTPSNITGYITRSLSYIMEESNGTYFPKCIAPLKIVDPRSSILPMCDTHKGFVKGTSLYMVTDDLIVTTTSSMSLVSFLSKSNISPYDIEERVISIGRNQCLSILKASLISSSALTNGLGQFLYPVKEENISN